MRRPARALLLSLALLAHGCAPGSPSSPCRIDKITLDSVRLGKPQPLQIYLPPGYTGDAAYPVLYFLADYGGTAETVMSEYGAAAQAPADFERPPPASASAWPKRPT